MTTYFITRHPGAVEWAKNNGFDVTTVISHAPSSFFENLKRGDIVIGILPVSLAYKVCEAGARFFDIYLPNLPLEQRGKELSAAQMTEYGATVAEYRIQKQKIKTK